LPSRPDSVKRNFVCGTNTPVVGEKRDGMIIYRIDERLDEVRDRTGRRPSFTEIQEVTGVSVSVLSNMRTKVGYVTTTRTIDALCRYFQCEPGELMRWRPDPVGERTAETS